MEVGCGCQNGEGLFAGVGLREKRSWRCSDCMGMADDPCWVPPDLAMTRLVLKLGKIRSLANTWISENRLLDGTIEE